MLGFLLGCLPGAGTTPASFMAYGAEKRFSRHRAQLGKGAIEGVVAPDAATNSASNASFVPTLVLGVPGGATTAVLLGTFLIYGIQPGPLLFENQPELVWGLLVSFFIGNVPLLVLNLPLAHVFAPLLRVRYAFLYPLIAVTSLVGTYSVKNSLLGFDGGGTIAGGLPVPICTSAHGTAFDLVGQRAANMGSLQNAFDLAVRLAG